MKPNYAGLFFFVILCVIAYWIVTQKLPTEKPYKPTISKDTSYNQFMKKYKPIKLKKMKPTKQQIEKTIKDLKQCYADISDVQGKKETKAQIQILTLKKITPEIFRKDGALIYRAALAAKRYMDGKCEESELY